MTLRLQCESPALGDYEFDADALPLVIGRSVTADLSLPHALISRHHCELSERDGEYVVRDLESTNGTMVNDELISERMLRHGDMLQLGDMTVRVCLGEARHEFEPAELTTL